jgi:hypothetical protein
MNIQSFEHPFNDHSPPPLNHQDDHPTDDENKPKKEKGPGDVVDVSWALGMFLSFLFHDIITNI